VKVLFDHQNFCAQRLGGIPRYFAELVSHLAASDLAEVTVIAPFFVSGYLGAMRSDTVMGWPAPGRLAGEDVWTRRGRLLFGAIASAAAVRSRRFDVVHETNYNHPIRWPSRIPLVTTVHDMLFERYPDTYGSEATILSEHKRRSVSRADHVICVSRQTQRDLVEIFDVAEEKTTVVHHGVTVSRSGITPVHRVPEPFILFVGARGGYKNFAGLCRALSASASKKEIHLVCVGGGRFGRAEESVLAATGLRSDRVHHFDVDDGELAWLYGQARAFVYPSLCEGFGLPILEAMALGCPVITVAGGATGEVAGDAALLADPGDIDTLRDAVERILDSDELRREMSSRGLRRASAFSWQRCAEQTADVYRRVCG
jgi:glycosyltransferase involved in cell wall biosynthesis